MTSPIPGGFTGSHEIMVLGGHVGTHLDAVSHVALDGKLHGGVPVAEAMHGGRYRRHDIDQVRSLVCGGVLYDVPRSRKVTRLDPGTAVGWRTSRPDPSRDPETWR